MKAKNTPKTIEGLLKAHREGHLSPSSEEVELPSLPLHHAEHALLEALTQEEQQPEPIPHKEQSLLQLFVQWWHSPNMSWITAPCILLVTILFIQQHPSNGLERRQAAPPPTRPAKKSAHYDGRKGHSVKNKRPGVSLYIGLWKEADRTFKRLPPGSTCKKEESLVFGFKTAGSGGYPYLVRLDEKRRSMLLFPFHPKQPVWFSPGKMRLLKRKQQVQQYQLTRENGKLSLVLLQSPKPLKSSQLQLLLKHAYQKNPAWLSKLYSGTMQGKASIERFSLTVK